MADCGAWSGFCNPVFGEVVEEVIRLVGHEGSDVSGGVQQKLFRRIIENRRIHGFRGVEDDDLISCAEHVHELDERRRARHPPADDPDCFHGVPFGQRCGRASWGGPASSC
jgi:hypothetical protein